MSYARLAALNLLHIELRNERNDLQTRLDDLVNGILSFAPECWNDDVAPDFLALSFVTSLLNSSTTDNPGHVNGCTCFSGGENVAAQAIADTIRKHMTP